MRHRMLPLLNQLTTHSQTPCLLFQVCSTFVSLNLLEGLLEDYLGYSPHVTHSFWTVPKSMTGATGEPGIPIVDKQVVQKVLGNLNVQWGIHPTAPTKKKSSSFHGQDSVLFPAKYRTIAPQIGHDLFGNSTQGPPSKPMRCKVTSDSHSKAEPGQN
jgi:hypothetical protein